MKRDKAKRSAETHRHTGAGGLMEHDQMKYAILLKSVPVLPCTYQYVPLCTWNNLNLSILKFDCVTLNHMYRSCTNSDLSLLSQSGWVRKLNVFFQVCTTSTSMYWFLLPSTNVEFSQPAPEPR